jgi:hypothetical protein
MKAIAFVFDTGRCAVNFQFVSQCAITKCSDDGRTTENYVSVMVTTGRPVNQKITGFPGIVLFFPFQIVHTGQEAVNDVVRQTRRLKHPEGYSDLVCIRDMQGVIITPTANRTHAYFQGLCVSEFPLADTAMGCNHVGYQGVIVGVCVHVNPIRFLWVLLIRIVN